MPDSIVVIAVAVTVAVVVFVVVFVAAVDLLFVVKLAYTASFECH